MKKNYKKHPGVWIVFSGLLLLLLTVSSTYAQTLKISGIVKDERGVTLPGVGVFLKGTNSRTSTDDAGKFSLDVSPAPKGNVVFSMVGYKTIEMPIGDSNTLNVQLEEINATLNDVVVVGYGVQKKVNVIGSVATIDAKSIENRPVTNLSSSLGGLSAGVAVRQSSGKPGADGATIRIRGTGTLNNNDALVIVDGIVGTIDAVNPNDVESVSILKDAAAASIYGSLAANGVILITTKKGNKGRTIVSYTGLGSIAQPSNRPEIVTDYIRHMNLINEGYRNVGLANIFSDATIALWAAANANPDGLTPQGIPNYVAYPNTDWSKVIYKDNVIQQHTLSLNGGSENTQFLLSAGYLNNPGTVSNTGSDKFNFRVNLESKVAKFLTVGTQTFGSYQTFGMATTDNAFNFGNNTTPGVYPLYDGKFGAPAAAEESATANNILIYLDANGGSNRETRINSTVYAKLDILKGLQFETRFNYQTRFGEINKFSKTFEKWNFRLNTLINPVVAPSLLQTSYAFNKNYGYTIDNFLRYNTTFAKNHDLGILAGYNQYYYNYYDFGATKQGLIDQTITTLGSATNLLAATGDEYDFAIRSYFGRINYAYKSKYLIEAVFRYDGSSRFSAENRWGFFPAFSTGWRISQEPFMEAINQYVSNLKLRASWGKTGNNASGNYDYQALYGGSNTSFNGLGIIALSSNKFANPNLKWETTTTTNIGLDGALLNGALNFEIDLYKKYTNGILFTPTIPITVGVATAATQNIAEVSNKGLEFTLGYQGKIGAFKYGISGNLAYNFNRVTRYKGVFNQGYTTDALGNKVFSSNLGNVSSGSTNRILEGHETNEFYVYNVYKGNGNAFNSDGSVNINGGPKDGMIRTPQDMAWLNAMVAAGKSFLPTGGVSKTKIWYGDLIYADNNGDGVYGNTYDQQFLNKSATPKFNYGLNLNFSYKNIDLSMLWSGSAGMWYYWNVNGQSNSVVQLGAGVPNLIADDHYYYNESNPNDPANNINGRYPRLKNPSDPQNAAVASDFFLYNASYLKLKNLQIGYTIPERISKKAAISRARLFFSGENVFTITGYPGLDPEIGSSVGYPTMRQYSLGLNVTF